jgi:cell division protein FtsI (penicillin-binding protein 3)
VILFSLVAYKLADLQVLNPEDYRELSVAQRVRSQVLAADRGTIYDRNGEELAISVPQRTVFVDPALIEDPSAAAAQLGDVLGRDPTEIQRLMEGDGRFAYVQRQVPDEIADAVEELALPGVATLSEPKRFAPNGELARGIVGMVDVDNQGLSGVEERYGDELTGTPGRLVLEQTPAGRTIAVGEHSLVPAVPGHDKVLSLDRAVQHEAERLLLEQVDATDAAGGMALVMRPGTGDVLAMANATRQDDTGTIVVDTNNAAVTTVYEPGSVMKVVTAGAALENGLVTPDTQIVVPDVLRFGDAEFSEHDFHGTVSWPVSKIISNSSNTGTIKLGQMVGAPELVRYLEAFGFGSPTALDLPNEQSGTVRPAADWWGSSMGTIPIGHGISVTPLQMLQAYNTVANGGRSVAPRLVIEDIDPAGVRRAEPVDPGHRVVSERTADQLNLMLRGVVSDGTGTRAAVEGYTVAGKTGTARKVQPNGTYADDDGVVQYQATFVGFAPAEDPQVSVIVVVDEPSRQGIYGGLVAAPVFSELVQFALRRYDVPPPVHDVAEGAGAPDSAEVLPIDDTTEHTGRVRAAAAGEVDVSATDEQSDGQDPPAGDEQAGAT